MASRSASFEEYRLLKSQENIKRIVGDAQAQHQLIKTTIKELEANIEEISKLKKSVYIQEDIDGALKVK